MIRILTPAALTVIASPALAAGEKGFFTLANTDFVVLIAFILFVGVLFYLRVPSMIGALLDKRAGTIQTELDEAKKLRDEAQALLASYERKQREVQEQADRIVETAKSEASSAAEQAKADIARSVERRLASATDQIASAEASAVREVRDQAVNVAVAAAQNVIASQTSAADGNKLIDQAIATVDQKLH